MTRTRTFPRRTPGGLRAASGFEPAEAQTADVGCIIRTRSTKPRLSRRFSGSPPGRPAAYGRFAPARGGHTNCPPSWRGLRENTTEFGAGRGFAGAKVKRGDMVEWYVTCRMSFYR